MASHGFDVMLLRKGYSVASLDAAKYSHDFLSVEKGPKPPFIYTMRPITNLTVVEAKLTAPPVVLVVAMVTTLAAET